MALTLIAALALGLQQGERPLHEQIGMRPDPSNGYFEYLAVGDVLKGKELGWYLNAAGSPQWIAETSSGFRMTKEAGDHAIDPDEVAFARRVGKLTPLQIKREAVSKYKEVLPLLEAARSKRAWDPRQKVTMDTIFPELAAFRVISRFLTTIVCDVRFAEGDFRGGTQTILDCYRLSEASATSPTLIGTLIARAIQAVALVSFQEHISRISLPDCKTIENYVSSTLSRPDMYVRAMQSEAAAMSEVVDDIYAGKDPNFLGEENLIAKLKGLDASTRASYAAQTKGYLAKGYEELIKVFGADVREMVTYIDGRGPESHEADGTASQEPLPKQIADQLSAVGDQVIQSAIIHRVQLRLVRVAALVTKFRWENEQLPTRLADVGPAAVITDPVTGQPFRYRANGSEFELSGTGAKSMGEIRLLYRRPTNSQSEPPPPQTKKPRADGPGLAHMGPYLPWR